MRIIALLLFMPLVYPGYSDSWLQLTNFGGTGRHRSSAFSVNGRGYMGLGHITSAGNIAYQDIWEYDPATDSWTQKADFGGGTRYHATAFSVGNKAYCGLGRNPSSSYFDDLWEFDPATNVWTPVSPFPGAPRSGAVAFVIDSIAYLGSGTVQSTGSNNFYAYSPATDSWSQIAVFPGNERNTGVAFTIGGKGYFGTGNVGYGTGNDFWEYKPEQDQWIRRADAGPILREGATGFSINGKGYILTGNDFGLNVNYNDVWEYDPMNNTWQQIQDFPGVPRRFMVSFTIGDAAYCGTGTNGINFNDFWRFSKTTGIAHKSTTIPKIYPIPASSEIRFCVPQAFRDACVRLYNETGSLVEEMIFSESTSMDCTALSNGTYFYRITKEERCVSSGKIMVIK